MNKNKCDNEKCTCNSCKCDPYICDSKKSIMKKKIFFMILLILLGVTLTGCSNASDNVTELTKDTFKTEITVWGMTCASCIHRITNIVDDFEGVIDVTVNLRTDRVTITHDESLDIEKVKQAIVTSGYNIP